MADAETARLCTQIILDDFGPLTSKVASELLTRGRLTFPQLVRFTSLKPRTVRQTIIVLVQHSILWHDRTEEEGEVFEVNIEECLVRLRFGRHVWQAEQLFGQAGREIVQIILDHGKMLPSEIFANLATSRDTKRQNVYTKALHDMVVAHYLKPSTVMSHRSPRDVLLEYVKEEKNKLKSFPTAKELRAARETAESRLRLQLEEAEKIGMKRKALELTNGKSAKKRHTEPEEKEVDDTVYFRVNYDKFNIHIRNKLIETAVRERFNESTALVMRATLTATEAKQNSLSEALSDPVTVAAVISNLDEQDDISAGLAYETSKEQSDATLVRDYLSLLSFADRPNTEGAAASFVSITGSKVQVQFHTICRRLRQRVLESVTRERHGPEGVRILRLLLTENKMDEKQISKTAMMAAKDTRPLLAAMSASSFVSIQEVAKSADRDPKRMFFLWYVDLKKAYSVLLVSLYKTLHNIRVRRRAEAEEPLLKAVLEKRERTDVSQDESLLTRLERDKLAEWDKLKEKLTVLEQRVEEGVFILRDLGTFGVDDD